MPEFPNSRQRFPAWKIGYKIVRQSTVNSISDSPLRPEYTATSPAQSRLTGQDKVGTLGVTALVVDDEVDICYLLKGILRYSRIDADCVTSLADADRALSNYSPSIVFLDNHLGDGLGVNYIRVIKERSPEVKVVMITAHDNQTDRDKAVREGVDCFIGKPFTKDVIAKAIESLHL